MATQMNTATNLNSKYTFDRFVVGEGNRFAHSAAVAVAENPGEVYNPLLIYGNTGLGKTHLLHAVGHLVNKLHPELQILYMTCEQLTSNFMDAVNHKQTHIFRKQFQNVDVLMIDNIELIAGKAATLHDLYGIFAELYDQKKQIIMTSSKPPQDLAGADQLLCSHFDRGLAAEIRKLDHLTRIEILQQNAKEWHLEIPDEAIRKVAFVLNGDVRQLEGYLAKLEFNTNREHKSLTTQTCLHLAKESEIINPHASIDTRALLYKNAEFAKNQMTH